MTSLQRTPLYDLHLAANARLVEFGGWEMPVQYQGIIAEHQAVRSRVGMFDVSHMGKFTLIGDTSLLGKLQYLVPSNLAKLKAGQAQYTVLLNEAGGIIDDVIFYYHNENHWSMIVNASTTTKDREWLEQHLQGELRDRSSEQVLLAVQGPEAISTLQKFTQADLSKLKRFRHTNIEILGKPCFIARTGYTGEDGCELLLDIPTGRELWQQLLEANVTPCGLGCRDTLRLEAGMHLYGQDMNDEISPLEADLSWLVHLSEKLDFIGREQLESQQKIGLTKQLIALEMQGRNIARHDYPIFNNGDRIGIVTSGTMSPTLGKAIALGYVPPSFSQLGQVLQVQIRNQFYDATVVKRPFYKTH